MKTISIHALRVEGDSSFRLQSFLSNYFYPRPPGGGRLVLEEHRPSVTQFLSTPSGWRATLTLCYQRALTYIISIHALRVEGDSKNGQNFRLFLRKREKNLPL